MLIWIWDGGMYVMLGWRSVDYINGGRPCPYLYYSWERMQRGSLNLYTISIWDTENKSPGIPASALLTPPSR